MDYSEKTPITVYGKQGEDSFAYFRVCPRCGRFVKSDDDCKMPAYQKSDPNATCARCGRVQMPFLGWCIDEDDEF